MSYYSTDMFQNKADMWRYLLEGGAVTNLDDSCDCFVYLKDGNPIYSDGTEVGRDGAFHTGTDWRPFPLRMLVRMAAKK